MKYDSKIISVYTVFTFPTTVLKWKENNRGFSFMSFMCTFSNYVCRKTFMRKSRDWKGSLITTYILSLVLFLFTLFYLTSRKITLLRNS